MRKFRFSTIFVALFLLSGCSAVMVENPADEVVVFNEFAPCEAVAKAGKKNDQKHLTSLGFFDYQSGSAIAVDPTTGCKTKLLPDGHKLISHYEYLDNPESFITEKEGKLHVFALKDNTAVEVEGIPALEADESVMVKPSINGGDRFFVKIQKTKEVQGLYGYEVLGSRNYFLDAKTKMAKPAKGIDDLSLDNFSTCFEYDSKFMRFFIWKCGEGYGSSTPLEVYSMADKKRSTVMDKKIGKEEVEMHVNKENGRFIVTSALVTRGDGSGLFQHDVDIYVVEPTEEPTITKYTTGSGIEWVSPYSMVLFDDLKVFAVGGANEVVLMNFDENNVINEQQILERDAIYANFPMAGEDRYYIHNDNELWTIEIPSGKVLDKMAVPGVMFTILR